MSFLSIYFACLLFLFLCYLAVHLYALKGLRALWSRAKEQAETQPGLSVIVAARNEEDHIGRCLQSLVTQEYPAGLFEIIVVNDRSTDNTAAIIRNYCANYAFVNLLNVTSVPSDLPPKKNALNEGIRKSKNDILVFTDADCAPPATWLCAIAREFTPEVGAVAGYSPIEQRFPSHLIARWGDFFLRYLEIKNAVGAAAGIGLGRAFMCTGRNLAYRKSVFHEVHGYEQIKQSVSGDDDLFIQLVQNQTRWKIRYMLVPGSFVPTVAPASVGAFINQRKRHFSAGNFYPMRMKIIFAIMHSFSALAVLSILLSPAAGAVLVTGKLFVDGWIFYRGTELLGESRLRRSLVPLEFASVAYNSFIGPLGLLGTFTWKGRNS